MSNGLRRDPRIQARLDAWAIWRCSPSSRQSVSVLARMMDLASGRRVATDDAPRRDYVPVSDLECSLTDRAVHALPPDLREAVTVWHAGDSLTLDRAAARLGVVRGTLHRRLCQADIRIAQWLRARLEARI